MFNNNFIFFLVEEVSENCKYKYFLITLYIFNNYFDKFIFTNYSILFSSEIFFIYFLFLFLYNIQFFLLFLLFCFFFKLFFFCLEERDSKHFKSTHLFWVARPSTYQISAGDSNFFFGLLRYWRPRRAAWVLFIIIVANKYQFYKL